MRWITRERVKMDRVACRRLLLNAADWLVYDARYAYCQELVPRVKPAGAYGR